VAALVGIAPGPRALSPRRASATRLVASIAIGSLAVWSLALGVPSAGPEMIDIPAGTLRMGAEDSEAAERPVHAVAVSAFAIDRFEIFLDLIDYDALVLERLNNIPNRFSAWARRTPRLTGTRSCRFWRSARDASYFLPAPQGFFAAQGLAGAPLIDTGVTFIVVPLPKT
jgi:hypothetical protein